MASRPRARNAAARPASALARVFAGDAPLVVAAVDVQDPGNLGAIARVAEAAFQAPDVTRLGLALGCTPLSVEELLGWMPPAGTR